MLTKFLYKQVDNTSLIVFRVFFGLLIGLEGFGAIATGWVKRTFIDPEFTFPFIGFEGILTPMQQTLQKPLLDFNLFGIEWLNMAEYTYGFYFYFALMGICGFLVMIGYKYRWSIGIFTILWTAVYLMQKTSYNNHYYLLVLLCVFMWIVPAHQYLSVDVKKNPALKKNYMPNWVLVIFILQLFIVYTYASVAKMYPDWWSGEVTTNLMAGRKHVPIVGEFLQQKWIHNMLTYVGVAFDLLVIPGLLWKRTRVFFFVCSIVFHLFNSFVLHIGIFPYMSLALCLFFFEPKTIRNIFIKKKEIYTGNEVIVAPYSKIIVPIFVIYFISQILLPLRHWTYEDDVLWTEEGHRLSWRMMLRSKSGHVTLKVVNKENGDITYVRPKEYTSEKQARRVAVKPDMMWQFVQFLKKEFAKKGSDVAIYANGLVQVNNHPRQRLFNPDVDLAAEEWSHFSHHDWLLPFKSKYDQKKKRGSKK
ncbi:vitamin K-dependent gamma-carboxylase [Kordia sp. SMS9]|uniref:HTTM domain-containing protein n=1 Tax=Kordia sp. SMS9 TaxID=2282170 RepID=UPI000E0D628A|nr:HTTM domain-containing protein [Kordia sp. SMS9]AXG69383.1 vitamin K-dependent gamma-carboxylase [Kordia sp. SMS9]